MKVVGLCHICSGPAMNTCMACGRNVCDVHFNSHTGICSACSKKPTKHPKKRGEVDIYR